MMKIDVAKWVRICVTLMVVAGAVLVGRALWDTYMNAPWTRDARVRADVVGIAPDVSGLVSEVLVRDNAAVKKGDALFRVDRERFAIALKQAEAAVEGRAATLEQAKRDLARYTQLRERQVVSPQNAEQAQTALTQADAAYQQAVSERDLARLNLERSEIKAPANGIVTNLELRRGDYVSTGKAVVALVDTDSLRVEGYFEETKLPRIHVGDPVTIRLMGEPTLLRGRVQSVAAAIEDRERTAGTGLLANINPTFNWVRLAQRVPVRIALEDVPPDIRLVAGLTATVEIKPISPAAGKAVLADTPDARSAQASRPVR
ncbi:efflux transporter, RND family, MFP subunit (plasmid) [Xanthobacter versatilis]|uniref:Efflux transporter, RND family, MFP subunit n=1 Tax=Xanthobacter autotrophicus (strain ATCC BAA-1158 / Py2) TaxID=78245 RepID=A7IQ42_XANP2|nr:efflux transporter, RND family, MFP subunit [Xanthobacter autotrophicus Py2]